MGCSFSSSGDIERKIPSSWFKLFRALKLTPAEINGFYKLFRKIDVDNSGSIDTVELLTLLDIENTRFTEQVLAVFDGDKSGKVDFREFLMCTWNYCTVGDASLDLFAFDLYDEDGSGRLGQDELVQMLKDIYGRNYKNNQQAKMVEAELKKLDGKKGLNIEVFRTFARTHRGLLFPAFKLQRQLQSAVLGEAFWETASNRRVQLSKGKYMKMADLMEIHLDKKLYTQFLTTSGKGMSKSMLPKTMAVINNTGTAHGRAITDFNHAEPQQCAPTNEPPQHTPEPPAHKPHGHGHKKSKVAAAH